MRSLLKFTFAAAAIAGVTIATVQPVSAACTRLGFSVNDYGKDGPTNDAKNLLDKYIAKKMAERGITNYRTGKKDINCELFLDVILFDEHTCRADATVCWDGEALPKGQETTAETQDAPAAAKKKTKAATAPADKRTTTGSIKKAEPVAEAPAAAPAAAEAPAEAPAEAADAPAAASAPTEAYESAPAEAAVP